MFTVMCGVRLVVSVTNLAINSKLNVKLCVNFLASQMVPSFLLKLSHKPGPREISGDNTQSHCRTTNP